MKTSTQLAAAVAASLVLLPGIRAEACDYHWLMGIQEPTGVWPTTSAIDSSTNALAPSLSLSVAADNAVAAVSAADAVNDAAVTSWMINTTGKKGHSPNATINAIVSQINADVQTVAYNTSSVYIHATGVPSHDVGPFIGNPAAPSDRNRTVRIPRNPVVNNGTKTTVGMGNIGVMVNGVAFFDARDAATYLNQGVWHQNANKWEASSFDAPGRGHPAPDMTSTSTPKTGNYHYHQGPLALINQLDPDNTGQKVSSLIGFAFDGFPVYGPYDHANADGTGPIELMTSSYQLRSDMTQRTTLPDGSTASRPGPDVSTTYPLGSYIEDYKYTAGTGTLDQYNGRFEITPEYPLGTYAYHVTLDANGAIYPYIIGPQYYGVVATDNLGAGTITVPADVTYYTPVPEPVALSALSGMLLLLGQRRRK
jgi:hypothetical protein